MIQFIIPPIKGSMHKPNDPFRPNQRARSGLCHSLPLAQPLDEFRLVGEQNFCGRIEQYIARDFETSVNK